jgi:hypothetical protein
MWRVVNVMRRTLDVACEVTLPKGIELTRIYRKASPFTLQSAASAVLLRALLAEDIPDGLKYGATPSLSSGLVPDGLECGELEMLQVNLPGVWSPTMLSLSGELSVVSEIMRQLRMLEKVTKTTTSEIEVHSLNRVLEGFARIREDHVMKHKLHRALVLQDRTQRDALLTEIQDRFTIPEELTSHRSKSEPVTPNPETN